MARAKRTDRAEARRRHRATFADQPDLDPAANDGVPDAPIAASARAVANAAPARSGPANPPLTRPSLSGAFRSSFRPIDIRGDLRALPRLVTHWSFFVPVVLTGLAVVLFQYFPKDGLAAAFFGYFSGVTPFGAVLFAGFFAPRASWLVGALVSIVAALFLAASLTVQYGSLPDDQFIDTGVNQVSLVSTNVAKAEIPQFVTQALTVGAIYGAFFAAAAAWYRRFLNRASPNRQRPSTPTSRRPDGKVPKKNQQRPILARRR
ncbi:MAG: hypothetical protein H0V73_09325 [Chloroflexi bacterium]|nr:hypothetical protein [Chloroflexota bacterium]